jgi:CheY-like chemotaxis protein
LRKQKRFAIARRSLLPVENQKKALEKTTQTERIIHAKSLARKVCFTIAVWARVALSCGNALSRCRCPALRREMPDTAAKPRIIVADDERVIADTLAMILNQSGFDARAVYSGEKAVELAVDFKPEMLISDVIMAGLSGIDAAIRIRTLFPQIKILLFSGQAATADLLEKARAQGYEFEILSKPVHPQDLLARLRA